jgi:hypothetical protein
MVSPLADEYILNVSCRDNKREFILYQKTVNHLNYSLLCFMAINYVHIGFYHQALCISAFILELLNGKNGVMFMDQIQLLSINK